MTNFRVWDILILLIFIMQLIVFLKVTGIV